MAKSSFSPFLTKLRQKLTKNDQKSSKKYIIKMWSNLTTKRGIVGVQVCQRESVSSFGHLNFTQNRSKINHQHEKWQKNDKNQEIKKTGKSEKVKKWQNQKITNHQKVKNTKTKNHQKSVKIHQKSWKPVLRPKTQNTGVHAEWQKCPHQMARKTRKVTFTP